MNRWPTIRELQQRKAEGRIRGFQEVRTKPKRKTGGRKVAKHFPKRSKEKDYIAWNLLWWANKQAVILEEEYIFHPDRLWQFDWCIPALMIAVEYEGGIFMQKSGHTNVKGISRDIDKYNAAQALGWKVIRFTALNYKDLISELNKIL